MTKDQPAVDSKYDFFFYSKMLFRNELSNRVEESSILKKNVNTFRDNNDSVYSI